MAKVIENECVNCGVPPCLGSACPNRNVTRYYCDECESDEQLYHFNYGEYCIDCVESMLEKATDNDNSCCCDGCGSEEQVYYFKGGGYCFNCIESMLDKVTD